MVRPVRPGIRERPIDEPVIRGPSHHEGADARIERAPSQRPVRVGLMPEQPVEPTMGVGDEPVEADGRVADDASHACHCVVPQRPGT